MIGAVSALALTMGMAHAAETPTAPAVDQSTNAVEAVIVTGEKSSRGLQETTTSVAVTTARTIEREHLKTLYDVVNRTANMSDTYGKSGFTIRGVSNTNVSGGGSSGLATIYLDGAALPDAAAYSGPLEMWDIGQIEVFRGPQSTLQGRNALAGAVVIRSTDPTFTWGFKARAEAASGDERSIAFAGGGPIIADQLAFRLAVEDKSTDGFIYNPTRHVDAEAADIFNVRGKLLLTPTALPGLKALATYSHFKRDAGYLYTYSRTDTPDHYDHRVDTSGDPQTSNSKGDIFTLDASYKLTDQLTATGVVSWNKLHSIGKYDADYSPARISYGTRDDTTKTASQELRLNYAHTRFKGLLGFYHAKRDSDLSSVSLTNVQFPTSTLTAVMTQTLVGMGYSQPVAAATAADFSARFASHSGQLQLGEPRGHRNERLVLRRQLRPERQADPAGRPALRSRRKHQQQHGDGDPGLGPALGSDLPRALPTFRADRERFRHRHGRAGRRLSPGIDPQVQCLATQDRREVRLDRRHLHQPDRPTRLSLRRPDGQHRALDGRAL